MIKRDVVVNRDGERCITLETVSWREARLSTQSDSGIAPSSKTRALRNGQSRAVTGSRSTTQKMGSPMQQACCTLRQGIEREFLAQRIRRYLVGHVHSHVHRYMIYPRPWTVNGGMVGSGIRPQYGTARAVLSVVVQAKRHAGLQLPRCRLCFPTKQDADDAAPFDLDATRDCFFSSRGGTSRFVLSCSPLDRDLLTPLAHWRWPPALITWKSSPHLA